MKKNRVRYMVMSLDAPWKTRIVEGNTPGGRMFFVRNYRSPKTMKNAVKMARRTGEGTVIIRQWETRGGKKKEKQWIMMP